MHFDQRTQRALASVGLSREEMSEASDLVTEAVREDAAALEAFFDEHDAVYSDMEQAHSAAEFPEHAVSGLDTYTHADDLRGWLRFDSWGAYVEGGRVLSDDIVELTLGPTVNARVRFASEREHL